MTQTMTLSDYLNQLHPDQRKIHDQLKTLIQRSHPDVLEILFVRQPYFYLAIHEHISFHRRPSIMLSFFGDHVNVFALPNKVYKDQLQDYGFTDKNTMQIKLNQTLNEDVLCRLFSDALKGAS